jgi:vibriolysin
MRTNRKMFFIVTVVFVVCCLLTTSSWAAKNVQFLDANKADYIDLLNAKGISDVPSIGPAFGLPGDEEFTLLREITDFNGVTHQRLQQSYKGILVWGKQTIVSFDRSGQVVNLHGEMVLDIERDVQGIPANLNPQGALRKMQKNHKNQDLGAVWNFRNEQYGTYIVVNKKGQAQVCYVVSYFADTECGNPSRPVFFINVKSGKVVDSFDSLAYAYDGTGPGGNQKIGQYTYGTTYGKFGVAINGSTCTMNYADCKTVDLNHGTSGTTPFAYTCYNNTHESINGGYCPMNDAQYFGQQIYNMYQAWYSLPVLPFQLMMRCHYSNNYENAFWDGSSMTFGDGYTTFYPLVCLDVSAHEVSHGFTENHSNLTYSGQSGGINESYSDMAGEAAKYYLRGTNDFKVGFDIFKSPTGALRYMYDPPLDGNSIDHVSEYYDGLDVHYSSGIYNKVFWKLATTSGWTTRKAFDVFTKANTTYWTPSTTFQSGAEGAKSAAADYGYTCADVAAAFAIVGITISCGGGGGTIGDAVDYPTLTFTNSGNANWSRVTDVYYYDNDSAKSGTITHSQTTTIQTSVTVTSTQAVKFYWKVSSEANYDYLRFYIDGVQKNQISGTVNWTQVSNNIAAGTHTLKWTYLKDSSVSSGSDCGWVDKLEITTPSSDPIAEALDVTGQTFTLSGNANWYSQTTTTYYGGDAAQSGAIGHSQSCSMETTISGKTSVKFYWRVSSETNYDYLKFYIDGVEQAKISGSTSWAQKTYTVTTASHVLKWTYIKDGSVVSGSDCGWVDYLQL